MKYVPKHTTGNHFLMDKSWWFVMVFVVETIWISMFLLFVFFSRVGKTNLLDPTTTANYWTGVWTEAWQEKNTKFSVIWNQLQTTICK